VLDHKGSDETTIASPSSSSCEYFFSALDKDWNEKAISFSDPSGI